MNDRQPAPTSAAPPTFDTVPWLIAGIGLLAMYVPTFWDLFHGIWATEQQGHGPIVLGISLWLLWKKWPEFRPVEFQAAPLLSVCRSSAQPTKQIKQ